MTLTTEVKERAEKRKALIAAQRHAQHVRRTARIAMFYKDSVHELQEVFKELRACKDVLRGARTEYESTLTKAQREALQYARGWAEGRETLLREQAEREQNASQRIQSNTL
jgi:hypothetical protein